MVGLQERASWMGTDVLTLAHVVPAVPRAMIVGLNPAPTDVDLGHELVALRILDRAAIAVGVLAVVAAVVSGVWLRMIPIEEFTGGSWSVFSPFPFGVINVEIMPSREF